MITNILIAILFIAQIGISYFFKKRCDYLNKENKELSKIVDRTIKELNGKLESVPIYKETKNSYVPQEDEMEIGENKRIPFADIEYLKVDGLPKQKLKVYQ